MPNDQNPTTYIFFNGQRIARIDPGTTTAKFYVTDNIGLTALVTDASGNVLNESLFFPYGVERVISQNDSANNYKFSGKERDAETGLDDFGARYYDSALGRFMTPDWDGKPTAVPFASFGDPQTLNLYAYVENGPLNKVDADGHTSQPVVAGGNMPIDVDPTSTESSDCIDRYCGADKEKIYDPLYQTTGDQTNYEATVEESQQQVQQQSAQQKGADQAQQQSQSDNTLLAQNNTPPPPGRTPAQGGTPDSTVEIPDGKGGKTVRKFGPDGKAETDIDHGHDHGAGDPHAHDWDWGKKPPRQPGRPLTPEEQANIKKTAAGVVVGVGTGYIIYRVIRFLPSLAPPLWPTIPANLAIP